MRPRPQIVLATAACLLSLAACEETMTTTTMVIPPPVEVGPSTGTVLVDPIPVGPGTTVEPFSDLPDPAVATCMAEVARVANNNLVAPVSIVAGPLGQTVVIGVGEQSAPWECRIERGGAVSVQSLTNEGTL